MIVECPKCGKKTALLNNVCEHCGCKTKTCKECGNIVEDSVQVCTYCGLEFASEKVIEEKKEKESQKGNKKLALEAMKYTERQSKMVSWIAKGVSWVAYAILIIAFLQIFKLYKFDFKENTLLDLKKIYDSIKTLTIIGFIILGISFIISNFKLFLIAPSVWNKINSIKFDYQSYYKNLYTSKNGDILCTSVSNDGDIVDIQLINILNYKLYPEAKTYKLLYCLGLTVISIVGFVFAYLGLVENLDSCLATLMFTLKSPAKFEFNTQLIVASVIVGIYILIDIFLDKEVNQAQKFVDKIKQKK